MSNKQLVVELKRIVGAKLSDEHHGDLNGDVNGDETPALELKSAVDDDDGVDDSTHDSGVGEFPEEANGGASPTDETVVKTEGDVEVTGVDGGGEGEKETSVKKPAVKKPAVKQSTLTKSGKRRKKRKHIYGNPPCPIKRRQKMEAKREQNRRERSTDIVPCEFCHLTFPRTKLGRHYHNMHRYNVWKKKLGEINDPSKISKWLHRKYRLRVVEWVGIALTVTMKSQIEELFHSFFQL